MVETLGPASLPFMPEVLQALVREGADACELADALILLNQLMSRFRDGMAPLIRVSAAGAFRILCGEDCISPGGGICAEAWPGVWRTGCGWVGCGVAGCSCHSAASSS